MATEAPQWEFLSTRQGFPPLVELCRDLAERSFAGAATTPRFEDGRHRSYATFSQENGPDTYVWEVFSGPEPPTRDELNERFRCAATAFPRMKRFGLCTLPPVAREDAPILRKAAKPLGVEVVLWDRPALESLHLGELQFQPGAPSGLVEVRVESPEPREDGDERRPAVGSAPLSMLADAAIGSDEADHLGYAAYADALATLIDNPRTATPLTLAINAPWGAGKSSLARLVEKRLTSKPSAGGTQPHVTCRFDAWMHDEADHLSSAFVAEVAQAAARRRPWWKRLVFPLPSKLCSPSVRAIRAFALRAAVLVLAMVASAMLLAYVPGLLRSPEAAKAVETALGAKAAFVISAAAGAVVVMAALSQVWAALANFVADPASEAGTGSMKKVRRQLHRLIRQATPRGSRFVIFVDDLERCRPPRGVALLETVNQLLNHPDVVVVVLADMGAVHAHVELAYRDLVKRRGASEYGRQYVQKIIQLQFDLPVHDGEGMTEYLQKVTREPTAPPARAQGLARWRESLARRRRSAVEGLKAVFERGTLWTALRTTDHGSFLVIVSLFVGAFSLLFLGASSDLWPEGKRLWLVILDEIMIIVGLATLVSGVFQLLRSARIISLRVRFGGSLKEHGADATGGQAAEADEEVVAIRREQEALFISNDSVFIQRAVAEAIRHVPPLPRTAKRVLNRVRLLAVVAERRGLLDGPTPIKASELGKWVAMQERWPRLAEEVVRQPSLMERLERSVDSDEALQRMVEKQTGGELAQVETFLAAEPPLSSCIRKLALFRAPKPAQ